VVRPKISPAYLFWICVGDEISTEPMVAASSGRANVKKHR
jgi:hypothetical protein